MAKKPKSTTALSDSPMGAPGYFFGLIGRSVKQIGANPYPAVLYIALYTAASALSQLAQPGIGLKSEEYKAYEAVVNLVFVGTLPLYGLFAANERRMTISEFTYVQPRQFFYALATSLTVAVVLIFSAFALLIPLIWTLGWFALSIYSVVDKNLKPFAAMQASKQLSSSYKRYIWGATGMLLIFTIPFIFLAYIPYVGGIGVGFATVMSVVLYGNVYRDLQKVAA